MYDVLRELTKAIENRQRVALATIIDVKGASPARTGFKLLVWPDGKFLGNVGGGELEKRILQAAQEALVEVQACTLHYSLREEGKNATGILCGGEVTVFIEPYMTKPILLIIGGGHIGQPMAEMGRIVGYMMSR